MVIVSLLYCLAIGYQVWAAVGPVRGVSLGMTRQDVRARLGAPITIRQASAVSVYDAEGARLQVKFDRDGKVSVITCEEVAAVLRPCTNILGVLVGATEAALKLRLGPADREESECGEKLIEYDGLGVALRLRQSRVAEIEVHAPGGFGNRVLEAMWVMLPCWRPASIRGSR